MTDTSEVVTSPTDLTPVQNHHGLWVKREDLHRGAFGVNGAKYRACRHLMARAVARGSRSVVSAASVLSPQSAMGAVLAAEMGLPCTVIVGATTPEKAVRHKSISIAQKAGADIVGVPVGFNPYLQRAARDWVDEHEGAWRLPYGITVEPGSNESDIEAFLQVGAPQTMNLPDEVEFLIIPFGSGNTAAGVLYGLHDFRPARLKHVVLMGIGPDKQSWLRDRLALFGRDITPAGVTWEHIPLHPKFATYGDRMPETLDGITLHPTYEGKVVRFLNMTEPVWWAEPDNRTALWVVGGPL